MMKAAIEEFIKGKSIAIVGLSRSGKKFGNNALAELAKRGYEVFALHPSAPEISGTKGAESAESIAIAKDLDLNLVHGRCILMYAPPVEGFHAWHRVFHRLFARF